jgi:hypothetical protein
LTFAGVLVSNISSFAVMTTMIKLSDRTGATSFQQQTCVRLTQPANQGVGASDQPSTGENTNAIRQKIFADAGI